MSIDTAADVLVAGQRLAPDEFMRRYDAAPEGVKAELVGGVVHVMASPVSRDHGNPHIWVSTWLGLYEMHTPGVEGNDNTTVVLGSADRLQPDALLLILPEAGGASSEEAPRYVVGPPELVVEVARTTDPLDRGSRLRAYERGGVREYVVWRVERDEIEWRTLRDGAYRLTPPGADGVFRSEVFPGLWLNGPALVGGAGPAFHATVLAGLASPEHASFAAELARRMAANQPPP